MRAPFIFLCASICVFTLAQAEEAKNVSGRYPEDALECHATLSPNEKIICPEDRNTFCSKTIVDSSRQNCGASEEYPFDTWDVKEPGGLCVYKKCSSTCSNETIQFQNGEQNDTRVSFCCTESLCNAAGKLSLSIALAGVLIGTMLTI